MRDRGLFSGIDGTVRVIASRDGQNWDSVALLQRAGVDLRDPKLASFRGKLLWYFAAVPVALLTDKAYSARQRKLIDPAQATPSANIRPGGELIPESKDTTHFSVADDRGGRLARGNGDLRRARRLPRRAWCWPTFCCPTETHCDWRPAEMPGPGSRWRA